MGRTQINFEALPGRFPEGTMEQIDAVLDEGETRAEFLRVAVQMELQRREKLQKRKR